MLLLLSLLSSLAHAEEDTREQITSVVGWTIDGKVVAVVKGEAFNTEGPTRTWKKHVIYSLEKGEEDCYSIKNADDLCTGTDFDAWKANNPLQKGKSGNSCGDSKLRLRMEDGSGYPDEMPEAKWDDKGVYSIGLWGQYQGYLTGGVDRGDARWEHHRYKFKGEGMWGGRMGLKPRWSATCAFVFWDVLDMGATGFRDAYGTELYGSSGNVSPAGPLVEVRGTDEAKVREARRKLIEAGFGATVGDSPKTAPSSTTVHSWSRANAVAEGVGKTLGVTEVTPIDWKSKADIVVTIP